MVDLDAPGTPPRRFDLPFLPHGIAPDPALPARAGVRIVDLEAAAVPRPLPLHPERRSYGSRRRASGLRRGRVRGADASELSYLSSEGPMQPRKKATTARPPAVPAPDDSARLQAQADKNTPAWILALRKELNPADVAKAREALFKDRGIKLQKTKAKGSSRSRSR
jgi:hypothetical protein